MRLKSAHITNFKSIRDSNPFDVADVTCIVGKNESGKTALLQALYRLNPVVPEHNNFDVTEDYPRANVEEYRQRVETDKGRHEIVVRAEFDLDDRELGLIEDEHGRGVLRSPIVSLSKGYENTLYVGLEIDEEIAVRSHVQSAGLPPEVESDALKHSTLKGLAAFLISKAETQDRAFADAQAQANALTDEAAKSRALADSHDLAESSAAKVLRECLAAIDTQQLGPI